MKPLGGATYQICIEYNPKNEGSGEKKTSDEFCFNKYKLSDQGFKMCLMT